MYVYMCMYVYICVFIYKLHQPHHYGYCHGCLPTPLSAHSQSAWARLLGQPHMQHRQVLLRCHLAAVLPPPSRVARCRRSSSSRRAQYVRNGSHTFKAWRRQMQLHWPVCSYPWQLLRAGCHGVHALRSCCRRS